MKAGETYILTTREHGLHSVVRAIRDFDFDAEFRPFIDAGDPLLSFVETLIKDGFVAIAYDVSILPLGSQGLFDRNAEAELIRNRI